MKVGRRKRADACDKQRKIVDKWKSQFKPKNAFSADHVRQVALATHIQVVLAPGRLYSLPAGVADSMSFNAAVSAKPQVAGNKRPRLEPDMEADAASTLLGGSSGASLVTDRMFFRVVAARPSQAKQVPLAPASGRQLFEHNMYITVHEAYEEDGQVVA